MITNDNFTSRQDFIGKLLDFMTDYDRTAASGKWKPAPSTDSPHTPHANHFRAAVLGL